MRMTVKSGKRGAQEDVDLFRSRFGQMINMRPELVRLAGLIDWKVFDLRFEPLYADTVSFPDLVPTRCQAGSLGIFPLFRAWPPNR
jgi:IS5 family transposase